MTVEEFFKLFIEELKQNPNLQKYYRFLKKQSEFEFRKVYFCQRLQYIYDQVKDKKLSIWDCGCGYGTTAIFLAMNGIACKGSTLEFYYKEIPGRLDYWKKYGDVSLYTYNYEYFFDFRDSRELYDTIILQDTLHHIEPLDEALGIFYNFLKPEGKMILIEENGDNIIQNFKLFLRRGNKRVTSIYDEQLKKDIPFGNENIRSLKVWQKYFENAGFKVLHDETQYIRYYPPFSFNKNNSDKLVEKEQILWRKSKFLRKNLFFGLHFMAQKQVLT